MTDNNDQGSPSGDDGGKSGKEPINFHSHAAKRNRNVAGELKEVMGTVTSLTDLSAQAAAAFHVKHGAEETLFWISTESEEPRKPHLNDMVTIYFNDNARSLDVFGEKACGVVEMTNQSLNSEDAVFQWFRDQARKKKEDAVELHLV